MAVYIVVFIVMICCILTIVCCRRYVRSTFDSIDKVLEQILTKDNSESFESTKDNRISKLTHKANRIIDRYVSDVTNSQGEKEVIQGFISDMSHQMKTPLAGISMYAELLLAGNLSVEEQQEFLSRMKAGTEKLQWMMESLIKMSRLEAGAIQLAPEETNIKQTVSDSISSVIAAAIKKNIEFHVLDFEDIRLYHDKKWTQEVLINILENAIKYSSFDRGIMISVERLSLYTKLVITNHGIGFDKSEKNLIFKRFYRGKDVKDKEGAGLGLYLAALIMEKQGGYIMADSIPGGCTSVSLFLQNCK